MTIDLPLDMSLEREFHNIRRDMGSIPDDGSSRNTNGGSPTNAIAVLSFLLLPPLKDKKIEFESLAF